MILSTSQVTGGGPGKLQSKTMLDARYVIVTMYVNTHKIDCMQYLKNIIYIQCI